MDNIQILWIYKETTLSMIRKYQTVFSRYYGYILFSVWKHEKYLIGVFIWVFGKGVKNMEDFTEDTAVTID